MEERLPFLPRHLGFQSDNCGGQNKNQYVMAFLSWRSIIGPSEIISINFLAENHGKFSPDGAFGILSQKFERSSKMDSLNDFEELVDSFDNFNAVVCSNPVHDERKVLFYDYKPFLEKYFRSIKGIKKYHVFVFKKETPGVLFAKEWPNSTNEVEINLFKPNVTPDMLPHQVPLSQLIVTKPLSKARQWQLYDELRPFVNSSEYKRDLFFPKPTTPRPSKKEKKDYKSQKKVSKNNHKCSSIKTAFTSMASSPKVTSPLHHLPTNLTLSPPHNLSLSPPHNLTLSPPQNLNVFQPLSSTFSTPSTSQHENSTVSSLKKINRQTIKRCNQCSGCESYKLFLDDKEKKCRRCKRCVINRLCKKFHCEQLIN